MEVPEKILFAAQRLKEDHRINRITVRDFLRHFGAERRGAVKVQGIRSILDSLQLENEPDFETAWIDGPIWLKLKPGTSNGAVPAALEDFTNDQHSAADLEDIVLDSTPAAVKQAEEQCKSAPTSLEPESQSDALNEEPSSIDDPTFRIGSLPAANKKLVVVNRNDLITKAITLMLENDFSQLPVMQGEREVKGADSGACE